jgi:hypothetical protein
VDCPPVEDDEESVPENFDASDWQDDRQDPLADLEGNPEVQTHNGERKKKFLRGYVIRFRIGDCTDGLSYSDSLELCV